MAKTPYLSKLSSFFRTPVKKKTILGSPLMKWEISEKGLNPYYGIVSGNYYAMTGMPWLSSDARKAVMTEWFWQPIRGQPRRVDTNELRKYSNTIWVQSIVMTILNQISSIPWDIIPNEGKEKKDVENEIETVKEFFDNPNKNTQSLNDIIRAWIKDVLEIDAGILVKVFTVESYDFEHLEPRSGAPLLKPLVCPECEGKGKGSSKSFKLKAQKCIKAIKKSEKKLPDFYTEKVLEIDYKVPKPNYEPIKTKLTEIVSYNSPHDANAIEYVGLEDSETTCPFCNGTGEGRHLAEIYSMDGASFLKDADRTGWIYGYWQYSYAIPAHPMWFNRDEIVYFMQNPRSMSVYGYSAVQSSLQVIKSLEYSVKHNMSLFLDGAVPDGVVSVEDMGNEEMKRMKTAWENELKGQPHKVVFINKKTNFVPFAFNNRDMQFLEGQKEAWKQVIANFNMTPTDLGFTQDVNRSSATQQTELTRRKSIRPLLKKIENVINKQIMPELRVESVKFKYIIDDPVEERKAAELSEIYLRNGLKTINELRIQMALKPVEWGDENPKDSMMGIGARGQVTGRASEVREERPAELEAQRREKDYQTAFQSQVPFLTSIQNLTTNTPFGLPKHGHVNTQYPYADLAARCPGCGMPTIQTIQAQTGGITEPWYHCIRCDRKWSKEDLAREIDAQRKLHGEQTTAPKVVAESTSMNTAPHPELLGIAQRVQDYTETQGYPKKELAELDLEKKKKLKTILSKALKENKFEKVFDKIFELGIDQGTSLDIVTHARPIVSQIEKEIRKEKSNMGEMTWH